MTTNRLLFLLLVCGCMQREVKFYEYDEVAQVHKEWSYKINTVASKETIDWLRLEMPDKGTLWFGPYTMDNDSFDLEVDPLTKKVKLGTSPKGE